MGALNRRRLKTVDYDVKVKRIRKVRSDSDNASRILGATSYVEWMPELITAVNNLPCHSSVKAEMLQGISHHGMCLIDLMMDELFDAVWEDGYEIALDVRSPEQTVKHAVDYLMESFDVPLDSRLRLKMAIFNLLEDTGP